MKTWFGIITLAAALMITAHAATQSQKNNGPPKPNVKAGAAASAAAKDCSCSGSGCSCSCKGACCTCTCNDQGGCACGCVKVVTASLPAGTTVAAAAETLSTLVGQQAGGQQVVVLAGGDQIVSSDISTTPWQALARLNQLPGVRLGVVVPDIKSAEQAIPGMTQSPSDVKKSLHEIHALPESEIMSLCVHEEAGLPAALDALSRMTGSAFDVSGSPAAKFTLTARGTLPEILVELSSAAGVSITVAH